MILFIKLAFYIVFLVYYSDYNYCFWKLNISSLYANFYIYIPGYLTWLRKGWPIKNFMTTAVVVQSVLISIVYYLCSSCAPVDARIISARATPPPPRSGSRNYRLASSESIFLCPKLNIVKQWYYFIIIIIFFLPGRVNIKCLVYYLNVIYIFDIFNNILYGIKIHGKCSFNLDRPVRGIISTPQFFKCK